MEKIRLQKYISDCGVMSRRAAEAEIEAGNVKVNGTTAIIGQKIDPDTDTVELGGKRITPRIADSYTYIVLNKPRGYLSSVSDDRGRKCVTELTRELNTRLYPVGRLDMDSDGMLIMTNDGTLTERLTHPRHSIPKIYRVKVTPAPSEKQLSVLRSALVLDDYKIMPVKTDVISVSDSSAILEMTLFEGRNRQIRRMCDIAELKVLSLTRIAIGDLALGSLERGKWRRLTENEVEYLYKSTDKDNENKQETDIIC
ncbi:MAG: rRNA pseudouridine synthase [Ruminococcaceae bacterium]|nr:rRNA pseudouridine synthase [Oscillospiraceae bacterium]